MQLTHLETSEIKASLRIAGYLFKIPTDGSGHYRNKKPTIALKFVYLQKEAFRKAIIGVSCSRKKNINDIPDAR